ASGGDAAARGVRAAIGATLDRYKMLSKEARLAAAAAAAAAAVARAGDSVGRASSMGSKVPNGVIRWPLASAFTGGDGSGGERRVDGAAVAAIVVLERCNVLMRAYGEAGEIALVDNLLTEMAKAGVAIDARFCNAAMTAALRCGRPDRALQIFGAATGLSINTNAVAAGPRGTGADDVPGGRRCSTAGGTGDVARSGAGGSGAIEMFARGAPVAPNVKLLTTLITAYGHSNCLENAFAVLETFAGTGSTANCGGKGSGVVVGRKGDEGSSSSSDRGGIAPDTGLLNALAQACARTGQPDRARRVFTELMPSYGVKPDVQTYNILINAFARAKRPAEALSFFEAMLAAGLEPSRVTMTVVIKAHMRRGDTAAALAVLAAMGRQGVRADAATFDTVILGLMRRLRWQQAWAVFQAMKESGVRPTLVTYTSLMSGFTRCGFPERAIELFEEMRAGSGTGAAAKARG
ncbi:unnamed protein product, partial [Phaeothamnion confervicola]